VKRNSLFNCNACLEPQHCDCDCLTCRKAKGMTLYIVMKQDPDIVTKYENVVTISKLLDNTLIFWTRNRHGANHHYELKDILSVESN
jgi:hypothetical protein